VAAHSEGGGVEVDGGSAIMTKSLRNRTAMTRFEARVEVAACSEDGDEAAACCRAGIEDGRWWQQRGSF
jgi:hypothetical protein